MKKKLMIHSICILLFYLFSSYTIYAESLKEFSGLYFMQQIYQTGETEGEPLLLFSNTNLEGRHTGNIVLINGEVKLDGYIEGNVYIYGAKVYLGPDVWITGDIKTFSAVVTSHPEGKVEGHIGPLIPSMKIFINESTGGIFREYEDTLPPFIVQMAKVFGQMILGLLFLSFWMNTLGQGSMVLSEQPVQVLKVGVTIFLMFVALILIFILSVIGIPIAILILFFGYILISIGQVSLAIFIGVWIEAKIQTQMHIYLYFLIGSAILELSKSIPVLGFLSSWLLIPVVSIGVLGQLVLNHWVYRIRFQVPFRKAPVEKTYRQRELYRMITEGLDAQERRGKE